MKVCIVIPDGTGIRNYLYSNLVEQLLENNCKIVLLHNISPKAIDEINQVHQQFFEAYKLPNHKETIYQKLLRETVSYARLLHNSRLVENQSILYNWKPNKSSFQKKLFYRLAVFLGRICSNNYKRILKLEEKHNVSIAKNNNKQVAFLKKINPDVIFSTHQRAMNAVPIINAAKQLKIKTVGAIFSWDNVPKARLTVRTDEYIVWSDYMKQELNLYYPEIENSKITVTGTPQFEFYYNKNFLKSKKDFFKKYHLDTSKKTLCFSGDDTRTSPYDPNYLEDLASVIEKENLNIQLVLRRAPVDVSSRFDGVIAKYPSIIKEIAPLWNFDKNNTKNWQIIYPTFNDIELLINTVKHCDAVINVGSTMAHDFAMFGKPAIYINYNTVNSTTWNIETIYKFQHFRSMGSFKPVHWLNSRNKIPKVLNTIFDTKVVDNKKWLDKIAEHKKEASFNIAKTLVSCI